MSDMQPLLTYDDLHTGSWDYYVDPADFEGDTLALALYRSDTYPRENTATAGFEGVEVYHRTSETLEQARAARPDSWSDDPDVRLFTAHHVVRDMDGEGIAIDGFIWVVDRQAAPAVTAYPRELPQRVPVMWRDIPAAVPPAIVEAARHLYEIDKGLADEQRSMDADAFGALHDQLRAWGVIRIDAERP